MTVAIRSRLLLYCGSLGPVLFALAVIVVSATRPGYDHVSQFISELGETGAELAWVMNYFGFMLPGILILLFVFAAWRCLDGGVAGAAGALLLATFAVCLFLAGAYSCDVGCSPDDPSPGQRMHDLVSVIAFLAFILGVIVWGIRLFYDPAQRGFGMYSLASAVLSIVILVAMVRSEETRQGTGLLQRLFLAVLFSWMIALSIRLLRMPRNTRETMYDATS